MSDSALEDGRPPMQPPPGTPPITVGTVTAAVAAAASGGAERRPSIGQVGGDSSCCRQHLNTVDFISGHFQERRKAFKKLFERKKRLGGSDAVGDSNSSSSKSAPCPSASAPNRSNAAAAAHPSSSSSAAAERKDSRRGKYLEVPSEATR